ncbi:MAG: DNA polymerase Y family protein [Arenibacterium sp.]
MPNRRILSLWFPRLGAERLIRAARLNPDVPLAVVEEHSNMQVISSLNCAATAAGLSRGQPVRDAHAMCATLRTHGRNTPAEAHFLTALRRWAGKFSPWVAEETPDALVIDLTGCAHLFGGEEELLSIVEADCADMGLSLHCGIADSLGAAWALARYAGQAPVALRSGDSIDQEARATRARAGKRRHWTKGGAAPPTRVDTDAVLARIAPPGQSYSALSPLPVAALRLDADTVSQLARLGLRRVGDLLGQPRAALARRFGKRLVLRLDQAMGSTPEPVSPARLPDHFAVRLTLPEPIGLKADVMAGVDRLLPRLCEKLRARGRGARALRFEAHRTDQQAETITLTLARATQEPARIRPLLEMKADDLDAGFGIDMLRLEVIQSEALHERRSIGHIEAGKAVEQRLSGNTALDDLMGKLGARIGLEAITRRCPGASHIPEKSALTLAAAWSEPAHDWPLPPVPRPLQIWHPEPVQAHTVPLPPEHFRWRGRNWALAEARGPERLAPEWWLDTPEWRSGARDYWVVVTEQGHRLWLFYAHGAALSAGWFCHGEFA